MPLILAVILAVPTVLAVTRPLELTVATELLLEVHVIVYSAPLGDTVGVRVVVLPTDNVNSCGMVMPVGLAVTVTSQ